MLLRSATYIVDIIDINSTGKLGSMDLPHYRSIPRLEKLWALDPDCLAAEDV